MVSWESRNLTSATFCLSNQVTRSREGEINFHLLMREVECMFREGLIWWWRPFLEINYHIWESFTFPLGRAVLPTDFYLCLLGQSWVTRPALASGEGGGSSVLLSSSAVEKGRGKGGWHGCCVSHSPISDPLHLLQKSQRRVNL